MVLFSFNFCHSFQTDKESTSFDFNKMRTPGQHIKRPNLKPNQSYDGNSFYLGNAYEKHNRKHYSVHKGWKGYDKDEKIKGDTGRPPGDDSLPVKTPVILAREKEPSDKTANVTVAR